MHFIKKYNLFNYKSLLKFVYSCNNLTYWFYNYLLRGRNYKSFVHKLDWLCKILLISFNCHPLANDFIPNLTLFS